MKYQRITALLLLAAAPLAAIASHETDRKIEQAARSSYNYRTFLDDRIVVAANDGVVTLSGFVEDKSDKALAADTVENLPGVHRVKNELVVKSVKGGDQNAWIALKVGARLLVKSDVSAATTTVIVRDGVATLGGTADNVAQRELTEIYALEVEGVKSVTNRIVVEAKTPADPTIGEKIDDASVTTQVKYALLSHKSTSALKTKVTTTDGVVRLTGDAGSDAERTLATKLALGVRGTRSVTNDMTVKL